MVCLNFAHLVVVFIDLVVVSSYIYRQLPMRYLPIGFNYKTISNVASLEECYDQINEYSEAIALQYNYTSKVCYSYSSLQSYHIETYPSTYNQTVWYIRDDSECSGCLTGQRAQQLMGQYSYLNSTCIPRYDFQYNDTWGYCSSPCANQNSTSKYGGQVSNYRVGVFTDANCFIMTRPQVIKGADYDCDSVGMPLIYNDIYYCYAVVTLNTTSVTAFSDNACSTILTNGYGVKLIHPLIYGELTLMSSGQGYVGAYYSNGSYVYTDGTALPDNVTWASGYPKGNTFVNLQAIPLTLIDKANWTGVITCMSEAPAIS
ncbi:unnamed protein product [Bursaphelenchus okinawaensis]|uniref:Uncharacterized protein n=1 Tax=Bursaphelenchus okinawaensis TaxID=465554 RepID=A0A811LT56_9BILA|nr:unnamed protein product [Bursaphelenchus okinawaensis]CAG9128624.1 unnamed protein product [Bursaphelenchus okinawaensis]